MTNSLSFHLLRWGVCHCQSWRFDLELYSAIIYFNDIELKFGVWYRNLFRRKYILLDKGVKSLTKGTYFKIILYYSCERIFP